MDISLAKDLYLFELERRQQLEDATNTLITGMALVGGLLGFLLQAPEVKTLALRDPFFAAVALAFIAFVYALSQLIAFYRVAEYFAIPTAKALQTDYRQLEDYFTRYPDLGTAEAEFADYLIERYSEATEINAVTNFARGTYLSRGVRALAIAVLFGLTATSVHYIQVAYR